MNARGLAYVHHGGVPKMIEDPAGWGYGLRRGMSVFHVLRFASSAREALAMELNFPVGDVGLDPANTAGGFYADDTYGYIAESRQSPVAIREAGVLGETDFLYANNSAAHPLAEQAGWMKPYRANWQWDAHGGWRPVSYRPPSLVSLRKPSGAALVNAIQSLMYANSSGRNRFAFDALSQRAGLIDWEYLLQVYRTSGSLPPGDFAAIAAGYKKTGEWGQVTTGHAGNAIVALMQPAQGRYAVCVGPAARGLTAHAPNPHAGPVYGETNAFWEIYLASTPAGVVDSAAQQARARLQAAEAALGRLNGARQAAAHVQVLLDQAQAEYQRGRHAEADAQRLHGREALYRLAGAARRYNYAQVLAGQALGWVAPEARAQAAPALRPAP
jgi:hypothetical protein